MPASHRLLSTKAPWVYLLPLKPGQTAESALHPPSTLVVKTLNGRRCRTKAQLLHELAATLSFPDYFDPNWDALEECLSDLEWLPGEGYLLVVENADALLDKEEDHRVFLKILRATGRSWASGNNGRPIRPFHTVYVISETGTALRRRWNIPAWPQRPSHHAPVLRRPGTRRPRLGGRN